MAQNATAQANALAQRMLGPNIRSILSARGQYDSQEAQSQANARGFALAMAKLLKGIGPEVHQAYDHASNTTALFAKGFSDAEQHRSEAENASLGSFLEKAGVPHEVAAKALAHTGGTADVLYGLKGYGPGAALQHEGAAFGAAADQLPQEALAFGNESAMKLHNDQAAQDLRYAQMVAQERGRISSTAASILSQMGLLPNGQPKPGYTIDGHGNVVRSSSKSSETLAQQFASDQPKLNSAAEKLAPNSPFDPVVPYAKAAKSLFSEFKYLLKAVPKGQQARAKKLLNGMIRDALIAAGIKPPKAVKPVIPPSPYILPRPGG